METVRSLVAVFAMLFLIVGLILPRVVRPLLGENKTRLKVIGAFIAMFMFIAFTGNGDSESENKPNSVQTQKMTEEEKRQAKVKASEEIQAILEALPDKDYDKIKDNTWYSPFGGNIPARSQIYWYAGVKDNYLNERIKIVDFSTGSNWVFFKKVTFFSSSGKWTYDIDTITGQSGGGKSIDIVLGGKYEILDVPFREVQEGIKILIDGTDATIRLEGNDRHTDYTVPAEEINSLKEAYKLYELSKNLNGKVVFPEPEKENK